MGFNNFIFDSLFTIVPIFILIVFVLVFSFVILSVFSPKFRAKIMSRQIKATKYMTDYSKDDMQDIASNLGDVTIGSAEKILENDKTSIRNLADSVVEIQDGIMNEHGDTFKKWVNQSADIMSEPIKTTVNAIKEGLSDAPQIYCKHCGALIDADSTFCKKCGKLQ